MTKEQAIEILETCIETSRKIVEGSSFIMVGFAMRNIKAHEMAIEALRRESPSADWTEAK